MFMDVNLGTLHTIFMLFAVTKDTLSCAGNEGGAPDTATGEELTSYKQYGCRSSARILDNLG
jgi:hypothetical protein